MDGSTDTTGRIIDFTITLEESASRVFAALTDPRDLMVWAWGGIGHDPEAEVDLRPGGLYNLAVTVDKSEDWPSTKWGMRGVYIEVNPPGRLSYTVHWDAPVGYNQGQDAIDEVVEIELASRGDETELHYVHLGVPMRNAAAAHEKAIRHTFVMLADHLAAERADRT